MPRTIWTKPQSLPNGNWSRFDGEPPFAVPADGGVAYDVALDNGETFVVTPTSSTSAPVINGLPSVSGFAEVGQTLSASAAPSTGTAPISVTWQWLRDGVEISGAVSNTFGLGQSDEGTTISVRQTASNAQGSATATSNGQVIAAQSTGDVAVITALFVSAQGANGEVDLAYTTDRDTGVVGVLTTSAIPPSAAQITSGLDHTSANAASSFTDTWFTTGSDTLPDIASGIVWGTYFLHVLPSGGSDSDVVSSNGFQLETVSPVMTAGQTSLSGYEIELSFSEDLGGSSNPGDWGLSADGTAVPVVGVNFFGTNLSLMLATPPSPGQVLLLSYNGTDLTDTLANPVAAFAGQSISNIISGSFTENSVTVPLGSYLTAPAALPTDAKSMLMFASLTQASSPDTRTALMTWNGTGGGFHTVYASGSGLGGVRMRLQDGTNSINEDSQPVALGTRYHLLVSNWIDANNDLQLQTWIFDTALGTWSEVLNQTAASSSDASLVFGPDLTRLFCRSDTVNHTFSGTVNRIALWTGADMITDVSDPTIRDMFAGGGGIADPVISRVALGQPLIDFSGDAAAYNAGAHNGSLGPFTVNGTFA